MVFILCAVCAEAQVIWNVRAGVGVSNITEEVNFSWTASVGAEIPVSNNWMFLPSFQYAQKTLDNLYYFDNSSIYLQYKDEAIDFLQLPIQMGYKIRLKELNELTIKAGPFVAYSMTSLSKRFDFGVDAGIDFIYKHCVVGMDYQAGFIDYAYPYGPSRSTAAFLTFGYRF